MHVRLSAEASRILEPQGVGDLGDGDAVQGFRELLDGGWFRDDEGAVLIRQLFQGYFGERSRFANVAGYESAVNGRAIPDLDIDPGVVGVERTRILLSRGIGLARYALRRLEGDVPGATVAGYVSVSPSLMDPEFWTGNLTFISYPPESGPQINVEAASGVLARVDSDESAC
ncbi:MAG: hypothetical protein ACJ786_19185 [Catenulispora sp.]